MSIHQCHSSGYYMYVAVCKARLKNVGWQNFGPAYTMVLKLQVMGCCVDFSNQLDVL